ncbi:MAG: amino acid permease, partial [Elusimicrobia bacterium RBG_16_66_12]
MAILPKSRRLKKELTLADVYAIATGSTIAGGFFMLPGLAVAATGPALFVSYLIAAIPMIPAACCAVELATAMPRAGGAYYFLDRSLGPMAGTVGGIGTWLALVLKTTFALIAMGAYIELFFPNAPLIPLAAGLAIAFGVVNMLGARKSGRLQIAFVASLLAILSWFIIHGWMRVEPHHFDGFLATGLEPIFSTAGLVYISYMGVTKIASVSEEVKDPERNLPLGVFLSLLTAVLVYGLGTYVMVGVVSAEDLEGSLTPVALVAGRLAGHWGIVLVAAAAMLSFSSVANAGIMSSSRYPLAMGRDHLLPGFFATLGPRGTPTVSISVSVGTIITLLLLLDPTQVAKLASAVQLVLFAGLALAVIVMRESRIESYDPGFRSPAYPWLQLFGIAAPLWLVAEMGWLPLGFTAGILVLGIGWYHYYARGRVARDGAIYHVFERLGRHRFDGLDRELRGILKEKGLRDEDPFEEVVARAFVIDLKRRISFEEIVDQAAALLAQRLPCSAAHLAQGFLKGTRSGATPVARGTALPHLRLRVEVEPELVLVRCGQGIHLDTGDVFGDTLSADHVHALFFLVSSEVNPGRHLRILAQLAGQVDQDDFLTVWMESRDESQLKEALLRNERYLSLSIRAASATSSWAGRALRELSFPEGCLVAMIRRDGRTIVPRGSTVLHDDDRLVIIGSREGIR